MNFLKTKCLKKLHEEEFNSEQLLFEMTGYFRSKQKVTALLG